MARRRVQERAPPNRLASYVVARADEEVVGFAGLWVMVDEAHVTTFAVDPRWRRRGVGERLLLALLDVALGRHAREATLEVRLSNLPARKLYEKHGFRPVGIRPRYYSDNGEDALIMTTEALASPADARADGAAARRARRATVPTAHRTPGRRASTADEGSGVSGPLVLAVESSCDETGVALVEGGSRIRANVVASQVALHAPAGGIVPEVAARAHLRWILPVLDEAWADAGVTWDDVGGVAVTRGPGPGRLAARRDQRGQDAGLGPRQAARRREPPRGPRLRRRGCAIPGRPTARSRRSRSSPSSSPAGTRSSSR